MQSPGHGNTSRSLGRRGSCREPGARAQEEQSLGDDMSSWDFLL